MQEFTIFINFKTYPQGTGERALKLAQTIEKISSEKKIAIVPIVQAVDLWRLTTVVKIPVWVEHVDPVLPGKTTGFTVLESVMEAGAVGALINHSEHPLPPGTVKQILARVRGKGFQTIVAAKTLGQLERLAKLKPDFLAYEIAELIGGKISITKMNPKAVEKAVKIAGEIPLVVGAGINQAEDLAKAKALGAKGVLIASAVVLAAEPQEKLLELLRLF